MRTTAFRLGAALGGALLALGATGDHAGAQPIPPIDGRTVTVGPGRPPDGEPHVGCVFDVDLAGYDRGAGPVLLTFERLAPTGAGPLHTRREESVRPTVDLADALVGTPPAPMQGWHVRLTVRPEGSPSPAGEEAFWVTGCAEPAFPAVAGAASTPAAASPQALQATTTTADRAEGEGEAEPEEAMAAVSTSASATDEPSSAMALLAGAAAALVVGAFVMATTERLGR